MATAVREPVVPASDEVGAVKNLRHLLESGDISHLTAFVQGPGGQPIELAPVGLELLRRALPELSRGNAITIVPVSKELTTQEAADLLNVSRPFLVSLLNKGHLPYHLVGTHRRIAFDELMDYKRRRAGKRSEALAAIAAESERLGLKP